MNPNDPEEKKMKFPEIRDRLEKATPGEWVCTYGGVKNENGDRIVSLDGGYGNGMSKQVDDGEFIAHSPADMRTLLTHIDEQGLKIERLEKAVELAAIKLEYLKRYNDDDGEYAREALKELKELSETSEK